MTDLWTMQSREDEIEYCKQHGIDLPFDAKHSYSRDRNLWHISHEGLELEDPSLAPNYDDLLVLSVTPEKAPDQPEDVTMTFEKGIPKKSEWERDETVRDHHRTQQSWRQTRYWYHRYRRKTSVVGMKSPRPFMKHLAEQS